MQLEAGGKEKLALQKQVDNLNAKMTSMSHKLTDLNSETVKVLRNMLLKKKIVPTEKTF